MGSGFREVLVTGRRVAPAGPLSPHSMFCGGMCSARVSDAWSETANKLNNSWVRIVGKLRPVKEWHSIQEKEIAAGEDRE